jgi:hypothetical protein
MVVSRDVKTRSGEIQDRDIEVVGNTNRKWRQASRSLLYSLMYGYDINPTRLSVVIFFYCLSTFLPFILNVAGYLILSFLWCNPP